MFTAASIGFSIVALLEMAIKKNPAGCFITLIVAFITFLLSF